MLSLLRGGLVTRLGRITAAAAVVSLALLATHGSLAEPATVSLPRAAMTSAGVYSGEHLVRTLWGGRRLGAGAIELIVEGAALVQYAVQNVRRDPSRRKTGHFGWRRESLRHAETLFGEKRAVPQSFGVCR